MTRPRRFAVYGADRNSRAKARCGRGDPALIGARRFRSRVESSRVVSADRTPLPTACTLLIQEYRGSPVSNTGRSERSMPCRVPAAPAMVRAPTELSAEDIGGIADACHARRGEGAGFKPSEDVPGFRYEGVPVPRLLRRGGSRRDLRPHSRTHTRPVRRQRARRGRWGTAGREDRPADCRHRRLVVPSAWPAAPA